MKTLLKGPTARAARLGGVAAILFLALSPRALAAEEAKTREASPPKSDAAADSPASGSARTDPLAEAGSGASWRATRPDLGPTPKPVLPTFEKAALENGLTVLVARLDRLPLVAFELVTRGGAALDPEDRPGLGSLLYGMLEEGAGSRDALEFSDALADLGASFSAGSDRDRGSVSISGLARHADALVGLLADAVRRPRLEERDFERLKARTAAGIERQLGSPQGLAFLRLPALVYGADHPLGHPPSGTPASVRATRLEEVRRHHARLLAPERSAFVAVGDIELEEAVALAQRHFGSWKAREKVPFSIPSVQAQPRTEIVFLDKPGSPQTMAILARPLFGRGHPNEEALTLANAAWGGSFSSRLNMNLREEKGYTYGAGSQVSFRNGVGVFVAYSALERAFSAPGLREFFTELQRLEEEPIQKEELSRVKQGLVRGLPSDFERIASLASAASEIFAYDLPLDHYAQLASRLSAVPLERAREVAKTYLDPDVMQVLMVGDADQVVPALEGMGYGPIRVERP